MNKVLLFNPRSAVAKHRIPNSLMNIAASIEGVFEWMIIDGNRVSLPDVVVLKEKGMDMNNGMDSAAKMLQDMGNKMNDTTHSTDTAH